MGIIAKQSIRNSILTYSGVIIGAVNVVFLVPRIFYDFPEHWGLITILIYYMQVMVPIAQLGFPNTIVRFLPYFRDQRKPDFLGFSLLIVTLSLLVFSFFIFFFGEHLVKHIESNNDLIYTSYYFIIPMLIGTVFFETLNGYSRALFKSTIPTGIKELNMRIWTTVLFAAYYFKLIDFSLFIELYVAGYLFQTFILIFYLVSLGEFKIRIRSSLYKGKQFKEILNYSLFSILGGSSALVVSKIDVILIGNLLDLKQVAFYSIPFFIGNVIQVPARSIAAISIPIVADKWKENAIQEITSIYQKTSLNQLIMGGFIFGMIWINVDDIMLILGEKFGNGKLVLLFIGLSRVIDMTAGVNGGIILTSKYYRFDIVFKLILVALTMVSNIILIPRMGIEGAALATGLSILIHNIIKYVFLLLKYGMQPFTRQTAVTVVILCIFILPFEFIPQFNILTLSIFFRSTVFAIIFLVVMYKLKISEDINGIVNNYLNRFKK